MWSMDENDNFSKLGDDWQPSNAQRSLLETPPRGSNIPWGTETIGFDQPQYLKPSDYLTNSAENRLGGLGSYNHSTNSPPSINIFNQRMPTSSASTAADYSPQVPLMRRKLSPERRTEEPYLARANVVTITARTSQSPHKEQSQHVQVKQSSQQHLGAFGTEAALPPVLRNKHKNVPYAPTHLSATLPRQLMPAAISSLDSNSTPMAPNFNPVVVSMSSLVNVRLSNMLTSAAVKNNLFKSTIGCLDFVPMKHPSLTSGLLYIPPPSHGASRRRQIPMDPNIFMKHSVALPSSGIPKMPNLSGLPTLKIQNMNQ